MKFHSYALAHRLWPLAALSLAMPASAARIDDLAAVAALDTAYQAAVKRNDAAAMGAILAEDFVLVAGAGQVFGREQMLAGARNNEVVYERQEEVPGTQTVRVWGDTAVVTALLWIKGSSGGHPMDRKLWFSDTYARTPAGWRYVLGQVGRVVELDGQPVKP